MRILTPDDFTLVQEPIWLKPAKSDPKACSLVVFHTNLWNTPPRDESSDDTSREFLSSIIAASVTIPEIEVGLLDVDCYPDFARSVGLGRFRNMESRERVVGFSRCDAVIFHDDGDTDWARHYSDECVESLHFWLLGIVLGREYRPCYTLDDVAVRMAFHRLKNTGASGEDLWWKFDERADAITAAEELLLDFCEPHRLKNGNHPLPPA